MRRKVEPIANVIRWLSRKDAHLTISGLSPRSYGHLLEDAVVYLIRHQDCIYEQLDRDAVDRGAEMAEAIRARDRAEADLADAERELSKAYEKIERLQGGGTTEYVFHAHSGNDYDFLACAHCGQGFAEPIVRHFDYCPKCGLKVRRA